MVRIPQWVWEEGLCQAGDGDGELLEQRAGVVEGKCWSPSLQTEPFLVGTI